MRLELRGVTVRGGHRGIGVEQGGGVVVRSVRVAEQGGAGIVAMDRGTTVDASELLVSNVAVESVGGAGWGLIIETGAMATVAAVLVMQRVLIRDSVELGIAACQRGSRVVLTDVIFENVVPSVRGPGVGIQCSAGAAATLERVAILGPSGAAIFSLAAYDFLARMTVPSTVSATDLFIVGVRSTPVRFRTEGGMQVPDGRSVAYGLHPTDGSLTAATRFVFANGGHGFYGASGRVTLEQGVITGQLDAAGAFNGDDGALQLRDVARFGNADDEVARNTTDLPTGASLEPPTSVCTMPPCM